MSSNLMVHSHLAEVPDSDYPSDVVWEALRRGIVEQRKIVVATKPSAFADLDALEAAMANSEQAASEGADVPDDEAVK